MGEIESIASLVIFNLSFIIFIIAIIIFIKQYRTKKREHLNLLARQQIEHQKELLTTQFEIQTQTMQHIGREIHDNIGQKLALARIYSQQQMALEKKIPAFNSKIESINEIIKDSLVELRQLSKSLTDDSIEKFDIYELILFECNKANQLKICKVNFVFDGKNIELSYEIKSVLVRIIQEFIQNSVKHSKCKNIAISLEKNKSKIILNLKDDGKGFDIQQNIENGIGLKNMEVRTKMIEGTFHLESQIKQGTNLTVEIPIEI